MTGEYRRVVVFILTTIISLCLCLGLNKGYAEGIYKNSTDHVSASSDAIKRGLEFLKENQNDNGSISGEYVVATTALAGLSFLANGESLQKGPNGPVLSRVLEYIIKIAELKGFNITDNRSQMYGHEYALLFLTQIYGETGGDIRLREAIGHIIRKGISLLESAQLSTGGWGYVPGVNSDEGTLTAGALQALRAAHNAGFRINGGIIEKAKKYLQKSTNPNGSVNYQLRGGASSFALTAQALVALQSAGDYETSHASQLKTYLIENLTYDNMTEGLSRSGGVHCPYYMHFYATQALFTISGSPWLKYSQTSRAYLIKKQNQNGSWISEFGNTYATAMSILALSVPIQILPVFQR